MAPIVIKAIFTLAVFAVICGAVIILELRNDRKLQHGVK